MILVTQFKPIFALPNFLHLENGVEYENVSIRYHQTIDYIIRAN